MSFISFSQNDTSTRSIQLEKPIVKLVIKDLITGDEAKSTLSITNDKINLLEQKIFLKDSIILNLNNQVSNFNSILAQKNNQLNISRELSERLEKDLKRAKIKNKLTLGAGIAGAVAVLLLVK
tara:strand:+ start:514 stop:882 length:369 start_codon:yes stop_codon:yes gene_type:complete